MPSKPSNLSRLADAENLHQQGVPEEQIRKQTGWFKGLDGKTRFEINDSKMTFNDDAVKVEDIEGHQVKNAKLGEFINHPELLKAYPELNDIGVTFAPNMDSQGSYSDFVKLISIKRGTAIRIKQ